MENTAPPAGQLAFVYGSLKRAYWNNRVMTENGGTAEFVGPCRTCDKFFLFDGGFPFMAKKPVGFVIPKSLRRLKAHVVGEAFTLNRRAVENCDRLEGHPDFYRRERTSVMFGDGDVKWAWAYFIQRWPGASPIIKPDDKGFAEWNKRARTPSRLVDELDDVAGEGEV